QAWPETLSGFHPPRCSRRRHGGAASFLAGVQRAPALSPVLTLRQSEARHQPPPLAAQCALAARAWGEEVGESFVSVVGLSRNAVKPTVGTRCFLLVHEDLQRGWGSLVAHPNGTARQTGSDCRCTARTSPMKSRKSVSSELLK